MATIGSYTNKDFSPAAKLLSYDSSGVTALIPGQSLLDYIGLDELLIALDNRVEAVRTTDLAVTEDLPVGRVIKTTGVSVENDGGGGSYVVVIAGTGGIPMDNGNELLLLPIGDLTGSDATNADVTTSTGPQTVAGALDDRVVNATSLADMKTKNAAVGQIIELAAGGRSGTFEVKSGTPPSDPQEGIYVVLANGNYAERKFQGCARFEWWGADPLGVTDSTINLQAAVDSGVERFEAYGARFRIEGDEVYLEGPDKSLYVFGGHFFTNTSTRTDPLFQLVLADNSWWYKSTFDMAFTDPSNPFSDTGICIRHNGCNDIRVSSCSFSNTSADGVYCARDFVTGTDTNNKRIWVCDNYFFNTKRNGVAIVDAEVYIVRNNLFESDPGEWNVSAVIDIEPNNVLNTLAYGIVQGNVIRSDGSAGIGGGSANAIRTLIGSTKTPFDFESLTVVDNVIESEFNIPIVIECRDKLKNLVIANNTFQLAFFRGIQVIRMLGQCSITGNSGRMKNIASAEFGIGGAGNSGHMVVSNNVIHVEGTADKNCRGIRFADSGGGDTYLISGNTITADGSSNHAILVDGTDDGSGNTEDVIITSNNVKGFTSTPDIFVLSCVNALVANNIIDTTVSTSGTTNALVDNNLVR